MKGALRAWQHRLGRSLTLRWRLTLWTAGLLLVLGFGLTAVISVVTAIRLPQAVSDLVIVELVPTHVPAPGSLPTPKSAQATPPAGGIAASPVIQQVQEIAIHQVRLISLIAAGVFALVGAWGAYWIAQRALRPVYRLSELVQEIQVQTLDRRLALDAPSDEVKRLADAFDGLLARLERAFEQQSRFVADAAHELRTPLAAMRTNLEVIQQDPNAHLSDYRQMGATLERALDRLERLVDDLLLLAKGEEEICLEPVDAQVLLEEVVQELEPLAQAHQIALDLEITGAVELQADAPLLARAVKNLIENGIRYNHPGGTVTVMLHREANGVLVRVTDSGIGIPAKEQSHIFERFYRVDRSRARHRGGAGLGLSIAAHSVELHAGRIQVESTPGAGSTFTIWLPGL
ncbi:MAG: ATP-binding protein [Anaerolineae bacterium]|nr:ATP-binding protein [Anaerolineae bacterium]